MRDNLIWIATELWWLLALVALAATVTLAIVPYFEFCYDEEER